MVDTFLFGFNIVAPMVLLMLLGYYARVKDIFDVRLLTKLNKFAFNFCIPALMFNNVYTLKGIADIPVRLMLFLLISLMLLTILGIVIAKGVTKESGCRGVIVQTSFRSNYAVIGAAMALALGGEAGSAVSASLQAPTILYFNIGAVICLTIWSNDVKRVVQIRPLIISVCKNPLILAQVLAIVCLAIRYYIPVNEQGLPIFTIANNIPWFYAAIREMSKMASPLVLVLLGAQINFSAIGRMKNMLIVNILLRLVIAPILGVSVAYVAHKLGFIVLSPAVVSALLPLYGSPAPAASAVMAEAMDCDGELARQVVVWTTCLSMISLMVLIMALRNMGWV